MAESTKFFYSKNKATKGGRPNCNPNSATQKIRGYVSVRIHSTSLPTKGDEEALIQPDTKIRERRVSETSVGIESGICTFLIKEQKEIKQEQRERKMLDASRIRLDKANKKSWNQFGNKKSISTKIRAEKTYNMPLQQDRGEERINLLLVQRQAIRDGNLEKVIPPLSPQKAKLIFNRQKVPVKIAHSKSSSASSGLNSYVGTSADIPDTTQRDLTSNLRKGIGKVERVVSNKFDSFGRYSSGHGNNWDDDSDSDESFYCIGESRLSQLDKARRISGYGTDPWTNGPQKECRICGKASPAGVRGLCVQCEKDFRRSKTAVFDNSDDEPKPPPHLNIKKTAENSGNTQVQVREFHRAFMDDVVKTIQAHKRPQVITPGDHISQKVFNDDELDIPEKENEYVSMYERWQTPELRAQYRNPEYEKTRCKLNQQSNSPVGDDDAVPFVGQDDKQSKGPGKRDGIMMKESFYAYWEEVFEDLGMST